MAGSPPIVTSLFIAASGLSSLPARRSVPPPAPAVGAVRGEAPDARPVAGPREAVAEGEDRGAVTGPDGVREGGVGAAGDRRHLARRHVHDVDRRTASGDRGPVRRFAANAIRVPSGDQAGPASADGPLTRARAVAGRRVHEPQVALAVVHEPGPVVLVAQAVDVAVVGQRRLAGLGLGRPSAAALVLLERGAQGAGQDRELGAVRGPGERIHAARQVRQAARLAAVEGQQVDLVAVLAVLRVLGPVRLLLDQQRGGPR